MAKLPSGPRTTLLFYAKWILLSLLLVCPLALIYIFAVKQPSNDGNWMLDFSKLPTVSHVENIVHLDNVRDFGYSPTEIVSRNWQNRVIDPHKLERIWFVFEPFSSFKPVAHTYFVFDFSDQAPIAISAEPRRREGEDYSDIDLIYSSFNRYNLVYQWGSETDLTVSRALYWKQKIYMLPLTISQDSAEKILLQMLENTRKLEAEPEFYNLLLRSCNNELARVANDIHPGAIPPNLAIYLPGYAAELLYKLGYIPHDKPLSEVLDEYFITDFVAEHYEDKDFSKELRTYLLHRQ